jgi:hypothetical protein
VTTPLFQFNSSAVELFSGGGVTARINEVLMGIEQEVRNSLEQQAPNEQFDISWEGEDLVITLDESQAEAEFGRPGTTMRPAVRTALLRAAESLRHRTAIDV